MSDDRIENNHTIILVKKDVPKSKNAPLNRNSNISNSNEKNLNIDNKNFPNNKGLNPNDIANAFRQAPDFISLYSNLDFNLIDDFYESLGIGRISEMLGVDSKKIKELQEMLKDPSKKNILNNMLEDPSFIENFLNNPIFKKKFPNNPSFNFDSYNKQVFNKVPEMLQMSKNIFKKNEKNSIENSGTEISVPPDPFGSLNNNQMNQNMNSLGQIQDKNTENKANFIDSEINIDYKEKYKEELYQLKNMGFIKEEANIQALNQSNGNIDNALDILLK